MLRAEDVDFDRGGATMGLKAFAAPSMEIRAKLSFMLMKYGVLGRGILVQGGE
jgi:hypothetical protein